MKANLIYATTLILIVFGIIIEISFWYNLQYAAQAPVVVGPLSISLAPEVETILMRKIKLIEILLKDPAIIDEVKKANEAHKNVSQNDIAKFDALWISASLDDPMFKPFLANQAAIKLIEFQETNVGFSEIFITDVYGLNVAITNKTSDYYQADEDWWTQSYNKGDGGAWHGPIEFDQSAQTEGISLYAPINDPQTQKTIGIAKAVLTLSAIKFEL